MLEFDDAACGPLVDEVKARHEIERHISSIRSRLTERAALADEMRADLIRLSRGRATRDATALGIEHGICASVARELEVAND